MKRKEGTDGRWPLDSIKSHQCTYSGRPQKEEEEKEDRRCKKSAGMMSRHVERRCKANACGWLLFSFVYFYGSLMDPLFHSFRMKGTKTLSLSLSLSLSIIYCHELELTQSAVDYCQ